MGKGLSAARRWEAAAYQRLALVPETSRQMARDFISVGAEILHRRAVIGTMAEADTINPNPRYAMLLRDHLLQEIMKDAVRAQCLSCTIGGYSHGKALPLDDFHLSFMALARARVYFWEPELHHAALSGYEQFEGSPIPKEAWEEGIEFWVSPYMTQNTSFYSNDDRAKAGLLLDTPCNIAGMLIWGTHLSDAQRREREITDDALYSNMLMGCTQFLLPFPEVLGVRLRSGEPVDIKEAAEELRESGIDPLPRIRSMSYYTVGESMASWPQLVTPSRLFLRETLTRVTRLPLGDARGQRFSAKKRREHPEVTIIGLRRCEATGPAAASPVSVDWSCRWTVRGHWVRREKKTASGEPVIYYRHGHIKGPDDKPLKVPSEGIWHVFR